MKFETKFLPKMIIENKEEMIDARRLHTHTHTYTHTHTDTLRHTHTHTPACVRVCVCVCVCVIAEYVTRGLLYITKYILKEEGGARGERAEQRAEQGVEQGDRKSIHFVILFGCCG